MATGEAASASELHAADGHDHGHGHAPFIAHHFTGPRQQYDSCKLGIWLFLVTEVLFFSGLFVAYTIYRYHHPEVFESASKFLDTRLGALNTIVLLFSSLTMAWAVRAAQLEQRALTTRSILITIFCAMVFLGVKAVEYSHKWGLGIFVAYFFKYDGVHHGDTNSYLVTLSIVPGIAVVLSALMGGLGMATGKPLAAKFWGALALGLAGYFAGVGAGVAYEAVFAAEAQGHGHEASHAAAGEDHAEPDHDHADDHTATDGDSASVESSDHAQDHAASSEAMLMDPNSDEARNLGLFFSIYYFMTGLHAVHIIAGVIALAWIMNRSIQGHFRSDYFGPVDYVGLYWHLVDLIWIYLFPLLYLIG